MWMGCVICIRISMKSIWWKLYSQIYFCSIMSLKCQVLCFICKFWSDLLSLKVVCFKMLILRTSLLSQTQILELLRIVLKMWTSSPWSCQFIKPGYNTVLMNRDHVEVTVTVIFFKQVAIIDLIYPDHTSKWWSYRKKCSLVIVSEICVPSFHCKWNPKEKGHNLGTGHQQVSRQQLHCISLSVLYFYCVTSCIKKEKYRWWPVSGVCQENFAVLCYIIQDAI